MACYAARLIGRALIYQTWYAARRQAVHGSYTDALGKGLQTGRAAVLAEVKFARFTACLTFDVAGEGFHDLRR